MSSLGIRPMQLLLMSVSLIFFSLPSHASSGKDVIYRVQGQAYEGYYHPAIEYSDNAPLVLIVHDWDGLTSYEKQRAKMLSDKGYNVFAADLFGKGVRPTEVKDKQHLTGELYKDRAKMRTLMESALQAAKHQGADLNNAVAVGYCFGGTAILELARSGADMKGFVSFHGGLKTPEDQDYSKTKGKILVIHGSADRIVPITEFAQLTRELEDANIDHEMTTYSGARHAFSVFGSDRYHKTADKHSWKRFSDFLTEVSPQ
ncbi:dienelactone hydrolase family protein [Oceanospirillum sp.]|uniref:dienelactone hydrolase family protein n=1 Tax=Oceanospirillum sp. TaxID=2021254 RepID=UPI003A94915B